MPSILRLSSTENVPLIPYTLAIFELVISSTKNAVAPLLLPLINVGVENVFATLRVNSEKISISYKEIPHSF